MGSIAAQGLAALTGLLLARWLSVPNYGLYTVMISLIGAMNVLTQGGTHFSFTAILGRVWPDKARSADVVAAVLKVRWWVSMIMLPPLLGATTWLLHKNGATAFQMFTLNAILIAMWWADMQTRLVDRVLHYAHQTTRLQMLDTALAAFRLIVTCVLYFGHQLFIIPVVLLNFLVSLLRVAPIKKWLHAIIPVREAQVQPSDMAEIIGSIKKTIPVEVYFVFQTQIVLAALSILGTVSDVASFGALTRIGQLLVPITMFTTAFSVPIFSRAQKNLSGLLFGLTFVSLLPGILLIGISAYFPSVLLWLIGDNYAGLNEGIFWATIAAAATNSAKALRNLVGHRGWVRFNILQLPLGLLWIFGGSLLLDLSTLTGAFQFQLGFAIIMAISGLLDFIAAMYLRCLRN